MKIGILKMLTTMDKIIIATIVFLALGSYILFSYVVFTGYADGVEIFVDGKEYASYKFSEINDIKVLKIETDYGYNILEISDKGAKMIDASCPDKMDVKMGEISQVGQMIICVTNKISVRVTGESKLNVDKVTY